MQICSCQVSTQFFLHELMHTTLSSLKCDISFTKDDFLKNLASWEFSGIGNNFLLMSVMHFPRNSWSLLIRSIKLGIKRPILNTIYSNCTITGQKNIFQTVCFELKLIMLKWQENLAWNVWRAASNRKVSIMACSYSFCPTIQQLFYPCKKTKLFNVTRDILMPYRHPILEWI